MFRGAFFSAVAAFVVLPVVSNAATARDPFQAPLASGASESVVAGRVFLEGIIVGAGRRLAIVRSDDGIGSVVEIGTTLVDLQLLVTAIESDIVRVQDSRTDAAYVLRLRDDSMGEEVLP